MLYGVGALPLAFILYESSLYLHARFGWSQATLGKVLWIPPSAWEAGYFVWGAILDRTGPRYQGLTLAAVLVGLPIFFTHSLPTGAWVLAVMWLEMFSCAGLVVLSVSYVTRAFPSSQAGLLAGLGAGSWGAMGAHHDAVIRAHVRPLGVRARLSDRVRFSGSGLRALASAEPARSRISYAKLKCQIGQILVNNPRPHASRRSRCKE